VRAAAQPWTARIQTAEAPVDPIPPQVQAVMSALEARDAADRLDGTPRWDRVRAVTAETGRFLYTLALATGARTIVECGTSSGYSALWLAAAARATGGRVVTFEIDERKLRLAASSFAEADVTDVVELRAQDAAEGLAAFDGSADLVFLDVEKNLYASLLEPIADALRPGGLLVADNLISHEADLVVFREAALTHPRLTGLIVPIGCGELVAVKTPVATGGWPASS